MIRLFLKKEVKKILNIHAFVCCMVFFHVLCCFLPQTSAAAEKIPRQVVLTWQGCTQTTMTVTWRTDTSLDTPEVLYSSDPQACRSDYTSAVGTSETFDETSGWINSVQLTCLDPGTIYHVVIPHERKEETFRFRTASETPETVVFTVASDAHAGPGDKSSRQRRRNMFSAMAADEPDFTLLAGDLFLVDRWTDLHKKNVTAEKSVDLFFDDWHDLMITPDGRRIPLVPAEGNHDGDTYYSDAKNSFFYRFLSAINVLNFVQQADPKNNAPFYYNRLKLPGDRRYYALPYSPDITIVVLNSDHSASLEGQTEWLKNILETYQNSSWLFPMHHIGPYPGFRNPDGNRERRIRENWVPLYEQYGVRLVISGHDHVYKRTYPIKNNQIDEENGIIYIGDGGLTQIREPVPDRWYLYEAASENHYFRVKVSYLSQGSMLEVAPIFPLNPLYQGTPFVLFSSDALSGLGENLRMSDHH